MKSFLPILILTLAVVIAPVLAMRPSPRQAQLARLRASATRQGLQVRVDIAATRAGHADYVLPWRIDERPAVRTRRFSFEREGDAGWHPGGTERGAAGLMKLLPRDLPGGVQALRSSADGLVVRWNERGSEADVTRIAQALRALREALDVPN